jgi:hypothetical protein
MCEKWARMVDGKLERYVPSLRERVWDIVVGLLDERIVGDSYDKECSEKLSPYLSDIVEEIEELASQVEEEEVQEVERRLEQGQEGGSL